MHTSRRAFTLVELSIVLVIIGLLVGAIVAGRNIQRVAQVRNVLGDAMSYAGAFHQFQAKYDEVPGDFTRATKIWGAEAVCPGDYTTPSTTTATCDGDGDGQIIGHGPTYRETYRTWQHLSNAGLIKGHYTGVASGAQTFNAYATIDSNIPGSSIENAGYVLQSMSAQIFGNSQFYPYKKDGNFLLFGAICSDAPPYSGIWPAAPALSAAEAKNIDAKMDDGLPGMGSIITWKPSVTPLCASTPDPTTAVYLVDGGAKAACALYFFLDAFQNKQ